MDFLFTNSADGTRLRLGRVGTGSRDLLIVHGLAEHAERYAHVADAAAKAGWRVTVLELRGHGHSGGRRGHVVQWSDYVADVTAAAALLNPDYSILAHSMGGLVTLDSLRSGLRPARVALSNPLLGVRVAAPQIKIKAAGLLSRIWPTLPLGNELNNAWLSRDKAVCDAYSADPLVYSTITPRWYTEMLKALERVHSSRYNVPLALFYSDTDPITDAIVAKRLVEQNNGQTTGYPGMLHEIMNEIGKEQVISDILAWLNQGSAA